MKKLVLSLIVLSSMNAMALSIPTLVVGGVSASIAAPSVGTSASISCDHGCSEAVAAAKDDAAQVALGQAPTEVFLSAAATLRASNPGLEMTDSEAALIMLGISSK